MRILTIENQSYDLSRLPDEVVDDIRYTILDNGTPSDPDFYFPPLVYVESFNSPAMVLDVGGHEIAAPIDWCMAVGCQDAGADVEILPLTSLNERGFEAFVYNPISGFRHRYHHIEITNVYNDVKWFVPKMKNNQLLAVPLTGGSTPDCIFFIKEVAKQYELIDLHKLL